MDAPTTAEPLLENPTAAKSGVGLHCNFQRRHSTRENGFALEVEFDAAPGFTILFGASGAGKTTLLDCVGGLVQPNSGRITIGERVLFDSSQAINVKVAKRKAGYVFQNLALFPH